MTDYDPDFGGTIQKPNPRRGNRIIRILVVLGILVLLFAFSLPASRSARSAARRAQCVNNLKQIALALQNYEQAYKALPPSYTVDPNGRPLHSWRTLILPYLEQESLYKSIDLSKPWNDPLNAKASGTFVSVYHCPEVVGRNNTTTYLAIVAPNGCFLRKESRLLAEITDAHGWTLMLIEAGEENAVPWMAPVDAGEFLVMDIGRTTKLHHAGGTNICFVDGSAPFLKADTPAKVRQAVMSISGNDDDVAKWWW